jgi:phosphoribosylaminoimidazole-succinocarboxamide synthase
MPMPLFTPTTKAEEGHDLPISPAEVEQMVGAEKAKMIEEKSIAIYNLAQKHIRILHFFIADTKMEFGILNDELILIDELLTTGWNTEPPAPALPPEVIEQTSRRSQEVYERITKKKLD